MDKEKSVTILLAFSSSRRIYDRKELNIFIKLIWYLVEFVVLRSTLI